MLVNIPLEKILTAASENGGDFAEIFAEDTATTSIIYDNKTIERANTCTDKGYGIRVVTGGKTAYGFTNDPKKLLELAQSVGSAHKPCHCKEPRHVEQTDKGRHGDLANQVATQDCSGPHNGSRNDTITRIRIAAQIAWQRSPFIKQVQITNRSLTRRIEIINSKGNHIKDTKTDDIFLVHVTAQKNGQIQTGYELTTDKPPEDVARMASDRAVLMIGTRPGPRGVMPVVISSEAGGTIIHEAVGHGLEADLAGQGMSVYKDKIGCQVAAKIITVVDDATVPNKRGSFLYDDEGSPARRTVLIKDGILKTYMHSINTAAKQNTSPTGNGRRESYRFLPIVRMTNTFILPGKDEPAEIISSVKKGLFVKKMGGGQVNTLNGDFVFEAQEAYLMENGKIGQPVRGTTLIGNGPEILIKIDKVGSDLGFGIGTCGKEGQGVPVGHGMPTIRIPEITVGGI